MSSDISISELVANYKKGYSLDQQFYKDPEIYKKEIENIFLHHWILAGHSSQIPETGDFFLFEFDSENIIITRTKTGDIRAHLNVCRHRGSRVCLEKKGTTKAFTCPYHAWSYDLSGDLIAARIMNETFDKSENGLHQAHVALVGGLIFISLSEKPPSLEEMKKDLADVFDQFGFDHMKLIKQKSYPIRSNWKLAVENYQECYHCAPSHQEFAKIHAMAMTPEKFAARKQDYLKNASSDIRLKPSSYYFDQAIKGQEGYQYDRNPLVTGKVSGSLNGGPVAPLLGKIKDYDGAASEFMVGPVTFFLIYNDHMIGYRFLPLSLDECVCDVFWFVHEDAQENKDYVLDNLTWLWDVTTQADEEIIVNNQKGVDSHFYQPGKLSEMEFFQQHFLNWYLDKIA